MKTSLGEERHYAHEKAFAVLISKKPRSSRWVGIKIGADLGDIWSHYCTLNCDYAALMLAQDYQGGTSGIYCGSWVLHPASRDNLGIAL